MDKDSKRIKRIFTILRPYVNGRLITVVFEKYFNELEELVKLKLISTGKDFLKVPEK